MAAVPSAAADIEMAVVPGTTTAADETDKMDVGEGLNNVLRPRPDQLNYSAGAQNMLMQCLAEWGRGTAGHRR